MRFTGSRRVYKKQLDNGLTILVYPQVNIPRVSTQLWYRVGSRYEAIGQKGIAHFLEHMLFKGTKKLSESDINMITYKLSGSCNAFTAHDYTGYLFDFPSQNWQESLKLFADCMHNCTFKQELLNSELKAVIQELKMYRDNYNSCILEELFSVLFVGHPYHYPVIGFKHDLYQITREKLLEFYHNFYVPNNATLVVVGNVVPDEVACHAQELFDKYKATPVPVMPQAYVQRDLVSRNVTLYREVQNPFVTCAFVVCGAREKNDYALDVLNWIIGSGRGSRLYVHLVERLKLATEVDAFCYDLFEYGVLFIQVQPTDVKNIQRIIQVVKQEIQDLIDNGITTEEFERGCAKANTAFYSLFEDTQKLAYALGRGYLATDDENYILNYRINDTKRLRKTINGLIKQYLLPELMAVGTVLPSNQKDRAYMLSLQEAADKQDQKVLESRVRTSSVEPGVAVKRIKPNAPTPFKFPAYEKFMLSNGLEVLTYCDTRVPKIEAILEFKADHSYDADKKHGLANVASQMLLKGTRSHTAIQLAQAIEKRGMSLEVAPGLLSLSIQSCDCVDGFKLANEVLTQATLQADALVEVKQKAKAAIDDYWDEPLQFVNQLIRDHLYAHHPYRNSVLGTKKTVSGLKHEDIVAYVKNYITPHASRIAVVGDLRGINIKQVLEDVIGSWQGPVVANLEYPILKPVKKHEINHVINRDQVVLAFAGLSIAHTDPDYDKILLLDQIFGGGVLGSMNSRLFAVREQSGLFYTIAGSLLAKADKQPGMAMVRTLVSLDRLAEAEKVIAHVIETFIETITDEEFDQARNAVVNSLSDNFETYRQIASAFLYMRRFNRPSDYFDKRAHDLMQVQRVAAQKAAAQLTDLNHMLTVRIGRV